jgi:hypothetical protein
MSRVSQQAGIRIPEGLESRFSIRIHRILAELPHLTELELRKLRQTRMDSGRSSTLELLWELPTCQHVLRPSEPPLSLYSTKIEFKSPLEGGLNLTFFTVFVGRSTVVFIGGVRQCSGWRLGVWGPPVRPADHATWPGGQVSSLHHLWALDTFSTISTRHVDKNSFWKCANTWPAGQGDVAGRPHLGSVEPMLCSTSFPHVIFYVAMPYFGHNEDMHGFWSIWCFSVVRYS